MSALALLANSQVVVGHRWLAAPPAWVTFLIVLAFAGFAALAYALEHSPAGRGRRAFLAVLRGAALAGVLLVLYELVETTTREEVRDSWVVVMLDDSVSMSLKDRFSDRSVVAGLAGATGLPVDEVEQKSRLDLMKLAIEKDDNAFLRALLEKNRVKVYSFAGRPMPQAELGKDDLKRGAAKGEPRVRVIVDKDRAAKAGVSVEDVLAALERAAGAGGLDRERLVVRGEAARSSARLFGLEVRGGTQLRDVATLENMTGSGTDFLEKIDATGPETAIGDCLNRVVNETRGQHVAGIVLVTDGRSNAGALAPQQVARRLASRAIPLYTVGVGNPEEPRDIAIVDLQAAEVVIAGEVLPIKVSVKSQGFEGEEAKAEIIARLDDEKLGEEPIQLEGKGGRQDVGMRLRLSRPNGDPIAPGEYTLSVEIPPRPGELIQDNNRMSRRIRVIDKKIKVLFVDAMPRWEFRFLRWGLIRDKDMEAQTFQISADDSFVQDSSPGVPALTAIPSTREELLQYHVIVLGDVDPADLGDERMKRIREFVEDDGGGLLVIAGQRFMPRAYAGKPLEGLLPVVIEPGDELVQSSKMLTDSYRPKLTFDGRRHGIMQLENDPEQNVELWEGRGHYAPGLPGFFWYYRSREKKKTAEVLAVHPDAQTEKQEPVPIFALQLSGAGMTFFSATDDVWRWRAGVGDRYTYRFWKQAIRYLSTGRLLKSKRFSISTDKSLYDLGEKVQITAEVKDRNLKPAEDETQAAYLEGPDGQVEKVELVRPPHTQGRYEATRSATKVGGYKVWIASGASADKPEPGEDLPLRIFQVQVPVLEKSDPKMDEETLRKMASMTGGKYFPLQKIASLPPSVGTIREVSEAPPLTRSLWDRWWVVVGLVGLLTTEWIARKKWKML